MIESRVTIAHLDLMFALAFHDDFGLTGNGQFSFGEFIFVVVVAEFGDRFEIVHVGLADLVVEVFRVWKNENKNNYKQKVINKSNFQLGIKSTNLLRGRGQYNARIYV